MDACDKAAKLIECGNENSPEALAGLVDNMENAFAVKCVLALRNIFT